MDLSQILGAAPDVLQGLKSLGLNDDSISALADEVGTRLGQGEGIDLGDLLTGISGSDFLARLDVAEIASKLGLAPDTISSALQLIEPLVENFSGQPLETLGQIAGKLFN